MSLSEVSPLYMPPPLDDVPDEADDHPKDGAHLAYQIFQRTVGVQQLPYLIFGAGTLANQYNEDGFLNSDGPLRAIRLALRYGMCAFDTAPYYGSSETILGAILRSLGADFPRTSYKLISKAGRYGTERALFDYSPSTVRGSVLRSLSRLGTDHLDAIYMHDVEYIATPVINGSTAGDHMKALETPESWGLGEGDEAKIRGEGDQQVLDAIRELWKLKDEGKVKAVGISGYPLPTLLRIALLVLHNPPYRPLDILLSFSHYNLQNSIFPAYLPHFLHRAKIAQLIAASPFSMGLLTPKHPAWHPAPPDVVAAKDRAVTLSQGWQGGLPNLALSFAFREHEQGMKDVPRVVGLSTTREVHEAVQVWREMQAGEDSGRKQFEEAAIEVFKKANTQGLSWQSPPLP
ncbi:Aldo/keto reductase [Ramaria rubella]|nr:Aldo/keto reductase [Ramaria rubella]